MNYGELHSHDQYSLLDGVGTALQHARRAAEVGITALARSNHGSLSGVVDHINACNDVGILPVTACECYYRPNRLVGAHYGKNSKPHTDETWGYNHFVLLAKDVRGWRSLRLITSEAYATGFFRVPCIDDDLLDRYSEGLIGSTSCISGFVPQAILRGDHEAAEAHMDKMDRWFGDDWYGELQPHDFDDLRAVNLTLPGLLDVRGKPLAATKDAHFPSPGWASTQKISVMMRTRDNFADQAKKKIEKGDDWYDLSAPETCYLGGAQDTRELFAKYHPSLPEPVVEQALSGTMGIAERITPFMLDRSPKMPRFFSDRDDSYKELRRLVFEGLKDTGHRHDPAYENQAEHELDVLVKKDFCDFFLITHDFVAWARSTRSLPPLASDDLPEDGVDPYFRYTEAGGGRSQPMTISVRGSAGGSTVSYALRITTINPITWGLKFERFLNPDREGFPDIDLDFAPGDADVVKEYLKRRWGRDKVYDMIAHGTLQAKAAINRVSTVYNVPFPEITAATKLIDKDQNESTIAELRDQINELDRFFDRHPEVFEHASRLQKQIATISEHPAGVVLSTVPLAELMPVMKKSVDDDYLVTAFGESAETQIVSSLGFLKLDLLVITELAKIAYAVELVGLHYDQTIAIDDLPTFEDPYAVDQRVMEIFRKKALMGVFQYSGSNSIMSLTKRVEPEHMLHLCAINALHRPATLAKGVADEYVVRRHDPSKIEYWDPSVEPFLEETLGLLIYQENVMDLMVHLGGFSASRADSVRKIMSKWYRAKGDIAEQKLGAHREDFLSNAASIVSGGRPAAQNIWDFVGGFSDYSFPKGHAGQYSLLGYADGWLKVDYPKAFYASLMTFPPAKIKKPEERIPFYGKVVREARALFDLAILPPDINDSESSFTITKDGLRFGLKSIKGLGPVAVQEVIERRPFHSWDDLVARTDKCNAGGRKALGGAGALDRWGIRSDLTDDERADGEEERLGIVLSTPDKIGPLREPLSKLIHSEGEVEAAPHGQVLCIGGEITAGKEVATKRGPSLKLDIAFGAEEYHASFAPWFYTDEVRAIIDQDKPVVIRGAKDVAYNCIAVDSIELAEDVIALLGAT